MFRLPGAGHEAELAVQIVRQGLQMLRILDGLHLALHDLQIPDVPFRPEVKGPLQLDAARGSRPVGGDQQDQPLELFVLIVLEKDLQCMLELFAGGAGRDLDGDAPFPVRQVDAREILRFLVEVAQFPAAQPIDEAAVNVLRIGIEGHAVGTVFQRDLGGQNAELSGDLIQKIHPSCHKVHPFCDFLHFTPSFSGSPQEISPSVFTDGDFGYFWNPQ